MSPLVSVAIATYNHEQFIRATLDSVIAQDFDDYEIVVGDDCSSDSTPEILKEYCLRYGHRIKIRLAPTNQGVTANCNAIMAMCTGKYVAWLGGDDLMLPGKLRIQSDYMERYDECVFSFHQLRIFDVESGAPLGLFNKKKLRDGLFRDYVRLGCINGASSTMVRMTCASGVRFSEFLPVASDWFYWATCLESGGYYHYIDKELGIYQRHANNLSRISPEVSQGEIDSVVSAWLIFRKSPLLRKESLRYLSDRVSSIRFVSDYNQALLLSLRFAWSWRRFAALVASITTRGAVRF